MSGSRDLRPWPGQQGRTNVYGSGSSEVSGALERPLTTAAAGWWLRRERLNHPGVATDRTGSTYRSTKDCGDRRPAS